MLNLIKKLQRSPALRQINNMPFINLLLRIGNDITKKLFFITYRNGYPIEIDGRRLVLDPAFLLQREVVGELLLDAMLEHVRPNTVVIDVGSWVGVYAVLVSKTAGPEGLVYAFEPNPMNYQQLIKHIKMNDLRGRIEPIQMACSNRPGKLALTNVPFSSENRLDVNGEITSFDSGFVWVDVTTLDAFCAEREINPSLIKIDVEGAEFHVLQGARDILMYNRPIVLCEFHPHLWPLFHTDYSLIRTYVEETGYQIQELGERALQNAESIRYVKLAPVDL